MPVCRSTQSSPSTPRVEKSRRSSTAIPADCGFRRMDAAWHSFPANGGRTSRHPSEFEQSLWIRGLTGMPSPSESFGWGPIRAEDCRSGQRMAHSSPSVWAVMTSRASNGFTRLSGSTPTDRAVSPSKSPTEDTVQDCSPDGAWVITASSRNAKIGWQLYVMRPDGSEARQITEGGNPFFARFSPDGQRLLYTDGTLKLKDRQGIWVVDLDGKNRRRILATGDGTASACWSPDGQRIAVAIAGSKPENTGD